jgi:6-phosphogluconolactonase (cycloisomerase 2 family)
LTADPAGAFAYGACTGGICAFSLDAATGVLTALAGNPFATGTSPTSLVLDPSGKFAFAICAESICVYELNPTTGTPNLTPASPFTITNIVPLSILVTN